MEIQAKIDFKGLDATTKALMAMPGKFARARKSAMSSVGYFLAQKLRMHIEYGGTGWPALHPLSKTRKKRKDGKWGRTSTKFSPLFWMGKFARYRVNEDASQLQVGFGKGRAAKKGGTYHPGKFDPQLDATARRHEYGETVKVTEKMRGLFAATRGGRRKAVAGKTYFPLKKSTTQLEIPARPTVRPVLRSNQSAAVERFRDKFHAALERYQKEGS